MYDPQESGMVFVCPVKYWITASPVLFPVVPFPFNVDFEDVYAQENAWNQHFGKGREVLSTCIPETTK